REHDLVAALPRLEAVGPGADRVLDRRAAGLLEVLGRVDAERRERDLRGEGHVGVAEREPHGQLVDRLDAGEVAGVLVGSALGALVVGDRLEVALALGFAAAGVFIVAAARTRRQAERGEDGEPAESRLSHWGPPGVLS